MIGQEIAKRYQLLDPIGQGGMGAVYKTMDNLLQHSVALKLVDHHSTSEESVTSLMTAQYRLALGQEFQVLATLHHPNIVHVLDYGFDLIYGPFFTMDFLEEAQTFLNAARNQAFAVQVRYLMQLLQALAYVHRRGLIHRDIKPANVLVSHDQQIKLLDFGLATITKEQKNVQAGTLLYMAPEAVKGLYVSPATDLYAVGVIAYELFAGRYPYDKSDIETLGREIAYKMPDLDLIPDNLLGDEPDKLLRAVIAKLLLKRQAKRFQDAEEVIRYLSKATGVVSPGESISIRDSYLQASQFIGREEELTQLQTAMDQAIRERGSAWLIGGEAGIGKSRLTNELRIYALVHGALVLQGQGIDGNDFPYQIWRAPLRRILLTAKLSDLELSILSELVPNIGKLLEREVPEIPTLVAPAHQQRLLTTVIDVFSRQNHPTLLILEDLQWVVESLEPLRLLLSVLHKLPLMIVATYRDDEAKWLPEKLPKMQLLSLNHFDRDTIAQLSEAMMGSKGIQADLIDLLMRETEGNVMFIVEVLRELAEEAGQLKRIGRMVLPEHVFSGGIQRILHQRLSQVGFDAQGLLKQAALIGRQLDLDLLAWLRPQAKLDQWLIDCSHAAVLEYYDGVWRFSHDILREIVLADISEDERPDIHRQVAEAIETVYPENGDYNEILLEHWHQSGNLDRETHYLKPVARYLLDIIGDHERAHYLLERASQRLPDDARLVWVWKRQAHIHWLQGNYDQSRVLAQQSRELAERIDDQPGIASSLITLGEVTYRQGNYEQALDYFQQSRMIYEAIGHQRGLGFSLIGLGLAVGDQGNYEGAQNYLQQSLAIFQAVGDQVGIVWSFTHLSFAYLRIQDDRTRRTFHEALTIAQSIQAIHNILEILVGFAWLYLRQDDPSRAGELAGLALYHKRHDSEVKQRFDELMPMVESTLNPDDLQAALDRGKSLDLDMVVQEILNEFGELE